MQVADDTVYSSTETTTIEANTIEPFEETTTDITINDVSAELEESDKKSELDKTTTVPPNINNSVRNENEIFKFSTPATDISTLDDSTETESSSYASYVIPIKIILPIEHVHRSEKNDSFERFNYILLKTDDVSYHEHIYSDNSDLLLPVNRSAHLPTYGAESDNTGNTEAFTTAPNADTDENGNSAVTDGQQQGKSDDNILVDSQGYKYELGKHYQISDEYGTDVVEFDDIAMVLPKTSNKPNTNQITKRVLDDDAASSTSKVDQQKRINQQHEDHYAKIFQWLHYHL